MVIIAAQELIAELAIVGQLSVECETEPLMLLQVVTLERLRITAVILATGGVSHVPDRSTSRVLAHQTFALPGMRKSKDFTNRPHFFVCVD